ncbi:MAG: cytochrome c maturation protein CcmE [Candidatus Dadabacteria bacterium]|nr:cytochrome c maturation protein CcmE [Candidatus Dadabacteria bacterium]
MKGKLKFILPLLVIVSLISWLVFAGVKDSMVYYITVDELLEDVPDIYGQKVRVSGTVVHGSIKNELDDSLRFTIADGKGEIDVEYDGIIPDIFTDGVEAVVEGKFSADNVFEADLLLAKCPTKYESEEGPYQRKEG